MILTFSFNKFFSFNQDPNNSALPFDRLRSLEIVQFSLIKLNRVFLQTFRFCFIPFRIKPLIFDYTQAIHCFRHMYENRLGHGSIDIMIVRFIPKRWSTKIYIRMISSTYRPQLNRTSRAAILRFP